MKGLLTHICGMGSFYYFAYGSNMLTERLAARCPSAEPLGAATVAGYAVTFSKYSTVDGSGKATLIAREGHLAHGALFSVGLDDLSKLDACEGPGYRRIDNFHVALHAETVPIKASVYVAIDPIAGLKPFCWYKALTIAGAYQHALPDAHVQTLHRRAHDEDLLLERTTRLEALRAFERAGIADYKELLNGSRGNGR